MCKINGSAPARNEVWREIYTRLHCNIFKEQNWTSSGENRLLRETHFKLAFYWRLFRGSGTFKTLVYLIDACANYDAPVQTKEGTFISSFLFRIRPEDIISLRAVTSGRNISILTEKWQQ